MSKPGWRATKTWVSRAKGPPWKATFLACLSLLAAHCDSASAQASAPPGQSLTATTVYFPSADARTELVAYLFEPEGQGPHPAVVLLHGRGGPYSSNVNAACGDVGRSVRSPCDATSLSKRHRMWAEYWARHGYLALVVDSFGPRGRAHGYARGSHEDPDRAAVNELTVRPLDAQGALAWLAKRDDVRRDRIMLQGWSNGGSTTLNTVQDQSRSPPPAGEPRYRAALAFYPGCGPKALLSPALRTDIPVWVFLGSEDEEVSSTVCASLLGQAKAAKQTFEVTLYKGATHDFDDPGPGRQAVAANRAAKDDAMARAAGLFDALP